MFWSSSICLILLLPIKPIHKFGLQNNLITGIEVRRMRKDILGKLHKFYFQS